MTDQEKLAQMEATIKNIRLKEALSGFQWNNHYEPDVKEVMANHAINKKLEEVNGALVVDGANIKLVRADNPDLELYTPDQEKLTLSSLVQQALSPLGTFANGSGPDTATNNYSSSSLATDPVTDPLTGHATWTDWQGRKHTKVGNSIHVGNAPFKPRENPDPRKAAEERLNEMLRNAK